MIARHLVRLLAGTANGAGNWPPGLRPNNKGKLSRSAAAPKRRSGLENGRSSSVRAEAVRLRPLVPNEDTSLVSVVLLVGNQGPFGRDLRKQVRQDTWKSASVRCDCHSVSHSAAGSALTFTCQFRVGVYSSKENWSGRRNASGNLLRSRAVNSAYQLATSSRSWVRSRLAAKLPVVDLPPALLLQDGQIGPGNLHLPTAGTCTILP